MLGYLLSFSLSRRPVILIFLTAFFGAGIFAYTKLNVEAYPNPAPVILEITAQAPGLSAEEMERYYTIPMEVGLATTPGINIIRSTSFTGLSFIRVTFNYDVDYYFAYTQAALNLQQNVSLPNNIQPTIQASSLVGEIFRYQLKGPTEFSLTNLRTVQDWIVQRRLLNVPGVVQVNTWGGTTKEFHIEANPNKMAHYGITVPQLLAAVGNANINVGGRTIHLGQQSVNIRGIGLLDSGGDKDLTQGKRVADIENIVLAAPNNQSIRIKDIAHVEIGYAPRLGKAGRDQEDDVVAAIVVMNRTMQTNQVVDRIKAEVERMNHDGSLPHGVTLEPFYDRTSLVEVTTHTVLHNLIFGCVLVFLIQWIFLGDLRSAIIVSTNIPFALFFSIILLVLRGDSANLLSLGAVDFGIIVDSAVILVENIFQNFQKRSDSRQELIQNPTPTASRHLLTTHGWTNRLKLIFISSIQVDRAILFSTAITISAFIPLFTMEGVEGQIFGPMARTYGYALVGALIATFTVTPVLSSFLLPKHVHEKETWLVRKLRHGYRPLLAWALNHTHTTVTLGGVFLLISVLLFTSIGSEFLPTLEEGNLWIRVTLPPTISLESGMPIVTRIREILDHHPELITTVSQHGRPDNGSDAAGFYNAEFFVPLKPFDEWPAGSTKQTLITELQKEIHEEYPGIELNFSQYIQDNVEEGLSGIKGANSVKILGPDLKILEQLAIKAQAQLAHVRGITDLGVFKVLGQPNLNIVIDRQRAARFGLNTGDVNTVIQAALGGTTATTLFENDRQFAVVLRWEPDFRKNIDQIKHIPVSYTATNGSINYVPLQELAQISLETGASYIYHEKGDRFIPVKFSVRNRDLGSTVQEAQQLLTKNVPLPEGYRMIWSGEFEELQQAQHRLTIVLPITLIIIILLLYTLFSSWRDSLLTLAAIPFAVGGGILALWASGLNFSISAAIGFISLFGVSVMNGILVMTYFNHLRVQGLSPKEAMYQAAEQRMRPMLMTALSACIGLLPAAFSTGIGSQVQRPLAIVVVGGMLIGPLMLLVVAPALQMIFLGKQNHPREPKP